MKKLVIACAVFGIAAALTACGGNYRKVQTEEEMAKPLSCEGLHMKKAQWHFTDDFGQQVDVTGACHAGMKHGNFEFTVNGKKVAVTKFVKDQENKTSCFTENGKTRDNLEQCMADNAQANGASAAAEAPAAPAVEEAPAAEEAPVAEETPAAEEAPATEEAE